MLTIRVAVFAACFAVVPVCLASGPTLQDRQQAACYDDVQRLCSDAIPDVDAVTACMKTKRKQVSAKCSAMWDVKQ